MGLQERDRARPERMSSLTLGSIPGFSPRRAHPFPVRSASAKTIVLPASQFLFPPFLLASTLRVGPASASTREGAPSIPEPADDIFLPFLQYHPPQQPVAATGEEEEEESNEKAETTDAIHRFFKSRATTRDPPREGRIRLKKNRRFSWSLEDAGNQENDEENERISYAGNEENDDESELISAISPGKDILVSNVDRRTVEGVGEDQEDEGVGNDGIAKEIVRIATSMPSNATLSECLGSYKGRMDAKKCVWVIRSLAGEGMLMPALHFFEWMQSQEDETELVSPRAYALLFTFLGKAGMSDRILVFFKHMPKWGQFRDLHLYNSIISALSYCRRYQEAWNIFEEMKERNIKPDHVTCSILLNAMRKNGCDSREVWQFFEKISAEGVKASPEVLGVLVKSFCDEGLKKEALIIQTEMEKQGVFANTVIYNTFIDAYCKSNQIEEAEGLFLEMKEKGVKPTTATYNTLMDAYRRRMQPEIVEDLLLEMQDLGLKPDVKSFTCLISAYGRKRKMSDLAADAFLRMRKAGISPTSHSYTAMIHAYSVDGWHEKAIKSFDNMCRDGIKPSIETFTALLDALRRAGDTKTLLAIWKMMIDEKIEGTRVTFNILLDGLAKQGQYAEARDVIHEFGKIGLTPTVMTYNMLMNAYARGGQHSKLPQLLKEMAVLNVQPDSVTYSTMIYAYVRVRDFKRAFYYHKQMVKARQVPDAKSYQKLRAILDVKATAKNRRDKSAILGIINSNMGLSKPRKTKKDEFWKNKKKRSISNNSNHLT